MWSKNPCNQLSILFTCQYLKFYRTNRFTCTNENHYLSYCNRLFFKWNIIKKTQRIHSVCFLIKILSFQIFLDLVNAFGSNCFQSKTDAFHSRDRFIRLEILTVLSLCILKMSWLIKCNNLGLFFITKLQDFYLKLATLWH